MLNTIRSVIRFFVNILNNVIWFAERFIGAVVKIQCHVQAIFMLDSATISKLRSLNLFGKLFFILSSSVRLLFLNTDNPLSRYELAFLSSYFSSILSNENSDLLKAFAKDGSVTDEYSEKRYKKNKTSHQELIFCFRAITL